jgi:protein SCO1/2
MSSSTENQRPHLLLMTALVISLSITAGSIFFIFYRLTQATNTGTAIVNSSSAFTGATIVDPPQKLNNFTLAGNDGNPLSLSDLAGHVTLIYFGYTNCPDFCPTTLSDFKRVKTLMAANASDVNFLMISVDGTRDNPVRMHDYLGEFDPDFLGMTGAKQEVKRIGVDFGLDFDEQTGEPYTVDHTASVFMVDQEGKLRAVFTYGTEPIIIAEGIKGLLS